MRKVFCSWSGCLPSRYRACKVVQQTRAAAVHDALRMPLDGDDGQRDVHDALDHAVRRAADCGKAAAEPVDRLMMRGIDGRAGTVQLKEEVAAVQPAVVDAVHLVALFPLVQGGGVDVLADRAAQMNVDELKPFADPEHGLFLRHKKGEGLKLQDIQLGVDAARAVILLSEKDRRDVAAAGQQQMRGAVRLLYVESGDIRNAQ